MRIAADDYTFTTNEYGIQHTYGTGGSCIQNARHGKLRMNLQGTDFHFHSTVSVEYTPNK